MTTLISYPLDNTDYSMEEAALYHAPRKSGISANEDFGCKGTGADNKLTIGPGIAWIKLSKFKGFTTALKSETVLDMGLPDPVYPRKDHVILEYEANRNTVEIKAKKGIASSNPEAPARVESESLSELHLFEAFREPGQAAIKVQNVTDLRLDKKWCGIMADAVADIDTDAINAQISALIEDLRRNISEVIAGEIPSGAVGTKQLAENSVVDSKIEKGAVSKLRKINLSMAAWQSEGNVFKQTVAVQGLSESNQVIVDIDCSSVTDVDLEHINEEWGKILRASSGENSITFTAREVIEAALPVKILEVKK